MASSKLVENPDSPDFSVVTPSFGQIELLKLCARSVADQTENVTVEHIIQDGGTGEEFHKWAASQSFASCHAEPDTGMYDAINRGFDKAQGKFLCWLNCDEQYLPGTLDRVAKEFVKHPEIDMIFGDIIVADSDFKPLCYRKAIMPWPGQIRHGFLPTFSAATFIRRRVIERGHLLDSSYRAIADAVWIHQLIKQNYRAAALNEPLSLFLQTGENMGQSSSAIQESRTWRESDKTISHFLEFAHRQIHRVRKMATGAYRIKTISTAIYHPGEAKRTAMTARLGGTWKAST